MPYTTLPDGIRLYYEFTGPEDKPVILQFGGSLFGRQNFGLVNDGFRENFRLLSFDARGYGRSDVPSESYSIEGWADDGAALLDAVGLDRVLVHGTSMGGMIALAFACKYPARCIAACPDVAFARPDVHRKAIFRFWRRCAETMSWDDFADHVTTQAVGCHHLEKPEGENTFEMVRQITRLNSTFTVRQACLAMEVMDLEPLVHTLERPILMTNGTYDMLCPPVLAKSGFSARQIAELKPGLARLVGVPGHRPRRPARVPRRGRRDRHRVLPRGARERVRRASARHACAPRVPHDAPVERAVRRGLVDLGLEAREVGGRHAPRLLERAPEVRPVVRDERVAAPLRRVEHDGAALLGHEAGGRQPAAQAPARPAVGLAVGPGLHDAAPELAVGDVEALRVPVGVGGEHRRRPAARSAPPRAATATGSSTYSSTCTRQAASCESSASGSAAASASTSSQPSSRAATASSIARAESIAVTCAPRATSAAANAPGPQPMSAMRQPGCGPSRSTWRSRTAARSGAA